MENWKKYLQNLGLSDTEANVYLEALRMGPAPVQAIARAVNLSRVSVYSIIESLTKLGLMTSVTKGKKQVYAVEPPERIMGLAENKIDKLERLAKEIKNNLQDLKMIQAGEKPVVKMYEGPEAFIAMQEDLLNLKSGATCEFGNLDEIDKVYPYEQLQPFHKKLARAKINRRIIYQTKNKSARPSEPGKQIKYLSDDVKIFKGDFFFYDDVAWLSSFAGKQISVMIRSREVKDTLQTVFDLAWKALK